MDFAIGERTQLYAAQLDQFMRERVYGAEAAFEQQERANNDIYPPVMDELKSEARRRGLWNLFLPDPDHGPGLSHLEYAPLAEIMGRSLIASEACNCSAPDSGNMELLVQFGTQEQKEQWLLPLLAGEIRSAFVMTEPDVASSDASNISMMAVRSGDHYVLNGRKWWITGASHPACRIMIVVARTANEGPRHRRQSQILVPMDAPGVEVVRPLSAYGYWDAQG